MSSSAACECGTEEQTVDHVVLECPIHRPPHGLHGLTVLDNDTIERLLNTCPRSSAAQQWTAATCSNENVEADDVIQKNLDLPQLCRHRKKMFKPKTFQFFLTTNYKGFRIFRWFEQLSTFIGWRVMAGYVPAKMAKITLFGTCTVNYNWQINIGMQ